MSSQTDRSLDDGPAGGLPSVERRTVLRGAAVGAAAVAAWWFAPASAAAQPGPHSARLTIRSKRGARLIHAPDGTAVQMPVELGALVTVRRGGLAAGSTLTLEWDTRLYAVAPVVALLRGGTTVATEAARPTVDATTHTTKATLVVPEPLAPGRDYVLAAGTLVTARYPDDLVADPVPLTVGVREPDDQEATITVLSRPGGATPPPWGAQLGAAWQRAGWDEEYSALHPALVTVLAVGPGPVPSGSRLRITLDSQVFADVAVTGAFDSSGREVPGQARRSHAHGRLTATWTAIEPMAAGDRLSVGLDVTTRPLHGELPWLEPPLVQFVAPSRRNDSQRLTGEESLTRADDIYSQATLEEFGTF